MKIKLADLNNTDIIELLNQHLDLANDQQASHAYSIEQLKSPNVYLFEARDENDHLAGVAGLKILTEQHGEIKSVRTHPMHLRKGVSTQLMQHVTDFAKKMRLNRLSLETHPTPAYAAARALYERLGYEYCEPFGEYTYLESSVFMSKEI